MCYTRETHKLRLFDIVHIRIESIPEQNLIAYKASKTAQMPTAARTVDVTTFAEDEGGGAVTSGAASRGRD